MGMIQNRAGLVDSKMVGGKYTNNEQGYAERRQKSIEFYEILANYKHSVEVSFLKITHKSMNILSV